ncbi:MAG TPA: hypothetical protein VKT32_12680 [Chthonomonadaceae bacterium]|nr:hypothetical protein [Chthonomonadaceae bacterium]
MPGPLSLRGLLPVALGLLLLLLLPPLALRLLWRWRRLETNFRGERIPQSFGLVILLWAGVMLALTAALAPPVRRNCLLWLSGLIGFGGLGFLDDTFGDRQIKGLRGHFRAALKARRVTTGFLKAVGGALLALRLATLLAPDNFLIALLDAALIALSANAINLLDLRPGRAAAVFLVLAVLLLGLLFAAGAPLASGLPLLIVFLPTLLVWERDAQAQAMMGDTGSNLLGAALGLALASTPLAARLVALLLLLALHVAAERVSLSAVIERHPLLRALDRLTGIR